MSKYLYNPFRFVGSEVDRIVNKYSVFIYLQYLRKRANMTQEQLSILSGLSVSTISRVECGGNVSINNLIRYANALGYELAIKKMEPDEYAN